MKLTIRPATQEDAHAWQRLRDLLWEGDDHESEIADYFRGRAEEPSEVLLAVTDAGEVIAYIELSVRHDIDGLAGVKTGYVEGLYVDTPMRGTGVALDLLRAAESWARSEGCVAFASDRDDRVIVHSRFPLTPTNDGKPQDWSTQ